MVNFCRAYSDERMFDFLCILKKCNSILNIRKLVLDCKSWSAKSEQNFLGVQE